MYFKNWNPPKNDDFRTLVAVGNNVSASFGCSFTEGVGVEADQTWSFLLGVANCGLNGASNDLICRTAIEYSITYIPKEIFVMWTFANRREYIDQTNTSLKFKAYDPGSEQYAWHSANLELSNDYNDDYNFVKNKMFLENFCNANNIAIHQTTVSIFKNDQCGTDAQHPGVEWHAKVFEYFDKNRLQ